MKKNLFLIFCLFIPTVFMAQTETQQYKVVEELEGVEIRFYPPVMMAKFASTNGAASSGFRSLFNYISGGNSANQKIAMTTPVHMETNQSSSSMAFVLPKKFTPNNTPNPTGKAVEVYEAPAGHFAAITYSGYTNPKKEELATQKLVAFLNANQIKMIGSPKVLVYNSPYKFYNRRNEVLVSVDPETF